MKGNVLGTSEVTMNRRILLVTDVPESRQPLERALGGRAADLAASERYYEIDSSLVGEPAVAKICQQLGIGLPYVVAFVDVSGRPGRHDIEGIADICRADPDLQVVVCLCDADAWQEVLENVGPSERLLVLLKPFESVEVCQLAHTLARKCQLGRQARVHALRDGLTGLANRSLFLDQVRLCLLRSRRDPDRRFAVLFGDLDRFKVINDSLGHIAGDRLLVEVAKRLQYCVRGTDSMSQVESDSLARLGGGQFVVLLDGLRNEADALRVTRRLQEALEAPFQLDDKEAFVAMSVGIAVGRPDYVGADDILRDANTALYQAKLKGRGGCEFFDASMRASALSRWSLETGLRRAVARNELALVYQPILSLASGELREFEALLRWKQPERGFISPAEFIPIAEETGLIVDIGEWVLETAIDQLARWKPQLDGHAPFSVAVNVSGVQLARPDLAETIARLLREKVVPVERLRIEVTESSLMRQDAAHMLTQLADMGLRLHLDDFGTGYSSLSYLHRLPVDALKIDRSFVNDMVESDTSASIVATIIALSHALGAHVIAEGVETKEQLEQLRALACDWAQGYYFDRPLDVEQATALLCKLSAGGPSAGDRCPTVSSPAQQAPAAPEVEPIAEPRAPTMP